MEDNKRKDSIINHAGLRDYIIVLCIVGLVLVYVYGYSFGYQSQATKNILIAGILLVCIVLLVLNSVFSSFTFNGEEEDPLASRNRLTKKNNQAKQKSTEKIITGIPGGGYIPPAYSIKPIENGVDVRDDNRKRKQNTIRLKYIVVPCAIMLIIVLLSLLYMYGK